MSYHLVALEPTHSFLFGIGEDEVALAFFFAAGINRLLILGEASVGATLNDSTKVALHSFFGQAADCCFVRLLDAMLAAALPMLHHANRFSISWSPRSRRADPCTGLLRAYARASVVGWAYCVGGLLRGFCTLTQPVSGGYSSKGVALQSSL